MNYKEQNVHMYRSFIKRVGSESLLDWLMSTDFFEAPASTKYHGNFPGGLAIHSLNVFERMRNNCVYEFGTECGGAEPFPKENLEPIAIVSLLHDVCKAEFYKQDFRNQKIYSEHGTQFDKRGAYSWESVPFYTVEEKFPFGHGEKSVFLINEHILILLMSCPHFLPVYPYGQMPDQPTEGSSEANRYSSSLSMIHPASPAGSCTKLIPLDRCRVSPSM